MKRLCCCCSDSVWGEKKSWNRRRRRKKENNKCMRVDVDSIRRDQSTAGGNSGMDWRARVCTVIIIQSEPYFIIDMVNTSVVALCEVVIAVRCLFVFLPFSSTILASCCTRPKANVFRWYNHHDRLNKQHVHIVKATSSAQRREFLLHPDFLVEPSWVFPSDQNGPPSILLAYLSGVLSFYTYQRLILCFCLGYNNNSFPSGAMCVCVYIYIYNNYTHTLGFLAFGGSVEPFSSMSLKFD